MSDFRTSRRGLLLGATVLGVSAGAPAIAAADPRPIHPTSPMVEGILDFIHVMTPTDGTVALAQSYADELGLFSTAFVYDSAVAICAAVAGGRIALARRIGDGLLFAQDNDPVYHDGRLRQAYNVRPYTFYDGSYNAWGLVTGDGTANIGWQFGFLGTAVGDMAWPGMALLQLHHTTRDDRYLAGARRIGDWIVDVATNPRSLGGFLFGVNGANAVVPNVSTEHNVDCIALFRMLEHADPDARWTAARERAQRLVDQMWQPDGGYFYTGSNDGDTINRYPLPLDPQTWGWLSMRNEDYAGTLDWARSELAVTDTPDAPNSQLPTGVTISGVTFSSASKTSTASYNGIPVDQHGVWLEGTSQLACALNDRFDPQDRARAVQLVQQVEIARTSLGMNQHVGGVPVHGGVVAASSLLDTGFGFGYFQVQHVGASGWAILAANRTNPMHLGRL